MGLELEPEFITLICGVAIAIGVFGVIVPVLPGVLLCWAAVLAWAFFGGAQGAGRWFVVGIATVIAATGWLTKYLWPGRRLKQSGVPTRALILGGLLGIVGFFVIPIVGLPIGFILGIYLAEHARLHDSRSARASTKHALKAVGLAMLIELTAALLIATTWVIGLITT